MKKIDMNRPVAQLVKEYPQLREILKSLGFVDITNPIAMMSVGRVVSLAKGAAMKGIPLDQVKAALAQNGFYVEEEDRSNQLKEMIQRLNEGESLDRVREDFVERFESVSVHEIIEAEQDLIRGGMETEEVQKLCDLHSALFHGRTEGEILEEERKAAGQTGEHSAKARIEEGHPVDTLQRENRALELLLNETEGLAERLEGPERMKDNLKRLKKIRILYGKKEEILMPILTRYGITGPSEVMWGVDDEIKAQVSGLAESFTPDTYEGLKGDILALITRMKEMIYKEENILFPLALEKLTLREWAEVYRDLPEMGCVFMDKAPTWEKGEELLRKMEEEKRQEAEPEGVIRFPAGELTIPQVKAILNAIPMDITFIDDEEINRFFTNEGKVFSRPLSAIGRSVYDCHPKRIVPMVKMLIQDFKSGKRDRLELWKPHSEVPTKILYQAIRDEKGNYLGTLELVQEMKGLKRK